MPVLQIKKKKNVYTLSLKCLLLLCLGGQHAKQHALVVQEELLALHLHGGATELRQQHRVVHLHRRRPVLRRSGHRHHRALVDLASHLLRDQDASLSLLRGLRALHQHALAQRLQLLQSGDGEAEHVVMVFSCLLKGKKVEKEVVSKHVKKKKISVSVRT